MLAVVEHDGRLWTWSSVRTPRYTREIKKFLIKQVLRSSTIFQQASFIYLVILHVDTNMLLDSKPVVPFHSFPWNWAPIACHTLLGIQVTDWSETGCSLGSWVCYLTLKTVTAKLCKININKWHDLLQCLMSDFRPVRLNTVLILDTVTCKQKNIPIFLISTHCFRDSDIAKAKYIEY